MKIRCNCEFNPHTISSEDCFELLCKNLYMDFVLDEDNEYIIKEKNGKNCVYKYDEDEENYIFFDERGDLFEALRNVAINIKNNDKYKEEYNLY